MTPAATIASRRATEADIPAIVRLGERALGWDRSEPNDRFFRWKHLENPFGPSPMWVATDGDRIAAFRTFLRWEFIEPGGTVVRAVRAVDTATDPDYQGQGLFTRLTLEAIDWLRQDDVAFVFNTPNSKSMPGYVKMGWTVVGRVRIAVRPRSGRSALRMVRASVPADKFSLPWDAGAAPSSLATAAEAPTGTAMLTTNRTVDHLLWRYGNPDLAYRVVHADDALVVGRLRRRGASVELVLCHTAGRANRLIPGLLRDSRADYAIAVRSAGLGLVPAPRIGPVLATRRLDASSPPLSGSALTLGDVELF